MITRKTGKGEFEVEQILETRGNRVRQYFDGSKTFTQPRFSVNRIRIINRFLQDTEIVKDFPKTDSTPENVIRILEENGIKGVKIFCIHSSRKETFKVKSNRFDWEIKLLTAKSKEKIPIEMLRRVSLLQSEGILIEKLYIAKPVECYFLELARAEIKTQSKILSDEIGYITINIMAGAKEANKALNEAEKRAKSVAELIGKYLADPVLLVKINGFNELIEVARWV